MNNLWTILYTYHDHPIHYDYIKKYNSHNQTISCKHKNCGWDNNKMWRNSDAIIRQWFKENIDTVEHNNIAILEWDVLVSVSLPDFNVDGLMANTVHQQKNHNSWYWFKEKELLDKYKEYATGISPFAVIFTSKQFINDWISNEFDEIYRRDIQAELRLPTIACYKGYKISELKIPSVTYNIQRNKDYISTNPGIHHPVKVKL